MPIDAAGENFRFGGFVLDLRQGVLRRDDEPAFLRPKAQALLTHLARNMGRVVPKSELMDAVWPGIYVTEDSLTQSIREIRKVLGDDRQQLVRTISRRGYMLAADIETAAAINTQPIVAVLRFRNETGDPAQVPIIDGFAEDLINGLARFGTVTVLARNSSFALDSDSPADWALARSRIGADYLVEGAVRRAESRLRVSVSLVDASNLVQLWGERYDAEAGEVFAIQQDIVERVIGRLVTRLEDAGLNRAARRPATGLAAYELSLRALALLRGNDHRDIRQAHALLESAIAKDPAYGLAHAYLALSQVMLGGYGSAPKPILAEALAIARRAIVLSPEQAVGHRVLSFVLMYSREHAAAEHHLRRSLELNPYEAENLDQMGYLLTLRGRPLDALAWLDRAVRLSPIHPPWYHYDRSLALYCLGDYAAATAAIELSPTILPWIRTRLAACYAQKGDLAMAQSCARGITEADPSFSAVNYARHGVAFEHQADNRHLTEGVLLALGLPAD